MKKDNPEMTANDVVEFVKLLNDNNIDVCIDGGWGVDALLEKQTRLHADLDIAIQHKDAPKLRALLEARHYKDVPRDDTRDCNFVLGDEDGHLIDIHSYTFDSAGDLVFGVEYPYDSLKGTGSISDFQVKCITPEWMVKFHSGYKLDDNDYHDVKLLCQKFRFGLPSEFKEFELKESKLPPNKSNN
jgi:lincosamide nucleotidyltransferase A/C/D/E